MFKKLFLTVVIGAFLLGFGSTANAQLSFTRHVVGENIPYAVVIHPIDLNDDGNIGLVGGKNNLPVQVYWFENDGSGGFTFHLVDESYIIRGSYVYPKDVNQDGHMDIVAALTDPGGYDDEVVWYENDGNENFTKHSLYHNSPTIRIGQPTYVDATDLDDDGDIDILATFWGQSDHGQVVWWENDGAENFTKHILHQDYRMGRSIIAADFDGDGDKDIVSTRAFRFAGMDWWENDGNENFTQHFLRSPVDCPQLGAFDLNEDGTPDLLYTTIRGHWPVGELAWYSWQSSTPMLHVIESTTSESGFAFGSFTADLDKDTDLDVLSLNVWQDKVYYYLKTSSGYSKYVLDTNSGGAGFVVAADFDNDGDIDVAVPSHNHGKVYWYENLLNQAPVADAGSDVTGECTLPDDAQVTLDGSGSSDPDGDPLSFSWSAPGIVFDEPTSPTPIASFPLGSTTVTLTVDDGNGETDSDEVVVTVEDTTPPDVTAVFIPVTEHGDDDDDDDHNGHDGDDNEEDEGRFAVQCSASDACDDTPSLTTLIEVPTVTDLEIKFKVKNHKKLKIDLKKNKVKVEAPDPQGFWAEVQNAGGISVMDVQEMEIKLKGNQKYEFKFDGAGNLNKVKAPEVTLICTATDASGNVGSAKATLVVEPEDDEDDDDDLDKTIADAADEGSLPDGFVLFQNHPNPFNPETEIHFQIPEASHVIVRIFNPLGQEIRTLTNSRYPAGHHSVRWDAKDENGNPVSSGVYLYQLNVGGFSQVKKMSLLR